MYDIDKLITSKLHYKTGIVSDNLYIINYNKDKI